MLQRPACCAISAIRTASSAVCAPAVLGNVTNCVKSTLANGLGNDLSYQFILLTAHVITSGCDALISSDSVFSSSNFPVPNNNLEVNSYGPIFNILSAANKF